MIAFRHYAAYTDRNKSSISMPIIYNIHKKFVALFIILFSSFSLDTNQYSERNMIANYISTEIKKIAVFLTPHYII